MNLKFFCYFFLLILFAGYLISIESDKGSGSAKNKKDREALMLPMTPENTIFAFDLHEVIFRKRLTQRITRCIKAVGRGGFFYVLNPFFLCRMNQLISEGRTSEYVFNKLVEEYPNLSQYKNDFYMVSNSYEPDEDVVEILKELWEKGFSLYVLSNIGQDSLEHCKAQYPEVFSFFKDAYVPGRHNNYNCKPYCGFFKEFRTYLENKKNEADKQIIFVDDLRENVEAALKCGLMCIHYHCVEDFRKILENLSILTPQKEVIDTIP